MFQSSPAPRRGRSLLQRSQASAPIFVSILARAEARALPAKVANINRRGIVSILARAEARALPSKINQKASPLSVSILARAEARALPGLTYCLD